MEPHRIDEPVFNGHAYVYEAGKEHARSIVLVHGLGNEGARDFTEQVAWLARSFHVVAVDLPGFGQSDKANLVYSPSSYAAFIKHVADRFVRRPFVLIGHSMGGVVALRYTALHPESVSRLVVVAAPGVLHRYAFLSERLDNLKSDLLPSAVDPFAQFAKLARKILGRAERSNFDPETILASPTLRERVLGGDPASIAGLAVAIENLSKQLPQLQTETLVIWGKDDTTAPLRTGKLLAHVLPRARLVVIDKAAHVPMQETPERFRAVLEPFLAGGLAAAPIAPVQKKHGDVRCDSKRNLVYEGEYDSLTLKGCKNVHIRNARVRALQLVSSTVSIEHSHIGGGEVGLDANGATVVATGGRIEGDVAINARGSRIDLAGVDVEGREAAVTAPKESSVIFSVSRVKSPYRSGDFHGYFAVVKEKPL